MKKNNINTVLIAVKSWEGYNSMTKENRNLPNNTYAVCDQHTHKILGFVDAENYHDAYIKAQQLFLFIRSYIDSVYVTRTMVIWY